MQNPELGFIMVEQCTRLTVQGPATLDMATVALPITQVLCAHQTEPFVPCSSGLQCKQACSADGPAAWSSARPAPEIIRLAQLDKS